MLIINVQIIYVIALLQFAQVIIKVHGPLAYVLKKVCELVVVY